MINKFVNIKNFVGKETSRLMFISIIAGLLWFLAEASFIYVFQFFLYSLGLIDKSQLSFNVGNFGHTKAIGVTALILFGSFRFLTNFLKHVLASYVQHSFIKEKRIMILEVAVKNAGKIPTGLLLSQFSETISQAGTVLYYVSGSIITSIATGLFIVTGFLLLPKEMSLSLGLLLLFLIPYKYLNRRIHTFGNILVNEWENVNKSLVNIIKNNLFIKIYNLGSKEIAFGSTSLTNYESSYKKYTTSSAFITMFPPLYGTIIVSLVSYTFLKSESANSVTLISFLYIFMRMAQSASETLGTFSFIKLNIPGFLKIYDWFQNVNTQLTIQNSTNIKELSSIEVSNLNFSYGTHSKILEDVNFSLSKGDVFVIKGHSGSGKSTLLSILMGLQKPDSGKILINNESINGFSLSSIIGYVGPQPYLINGTVRDNLLFGSNILKADDDLLATLKLVGLFETIMQLPLKLDEVVHEDAQFSTGQKQRLCIARSFLQNSEILIFDEATANLDPISEELILNVIKKLSSNKITIIVTHKDAFNSIATKHISLSN